MPWGPKACELTWHLPIHLLSIKEGRGRKTKWSGEMVPCALYVCERHPLQLCSEQGQQLPFGR